MVNPHMEDSTTKLIRAIDAFLEFSGLSPTALGEEVMNNRSFVRQLKAGGDVNMRTGDRVKAYMDAWKVAEANGLVVYGEKLPKRLKPRRVKRRKPTIRRAEARAA